MKAKQTLLLFLGVCCLYCAGCHGPYTASVGGAVTLDGKPLDHGKVLFHPMGNGPLAYAKIESNGSYAIRTAGSSGMMPGQYAVTIAAYSKDPWEGMTPEQLEQIRIVPARYANPKTSRLQFTIAPGNNTCDIVLKSGG